MEGGLKIPEITSLYGRMLSSGDVAKLKLSFELKHASDLWQSDVEVGGVLPSVSFMLLLLLLMLSLSKLSSSQLTLKLSSSSVTG